MQERKHTEVIGELVAITGRRIVDVGCGDGALVRFFAREGAEAIGVEPSPAMLTKARSAEPVAGASYVAGGGENLPLPDASVDVVVYMNALHHVPVSLHDDAIRGAARVLRPAGELLVIEPLAQGVYFELVRAIEDETAVRAAAYQALQRARPFGFTPKREVFYDAPIRFADFAAFEARMVAVDASRATKVARLHDELARNFAAAARRGTDGFAFSQPTRANLLSKVN